MPQLREVGVLVGNLAQRKMFKRVVRGRQAHVVLDRELGILRL